MRVIKFGIIILIILWIVSAPVAKNSRPGSFLYRVHVIVNEPVWAWMRITGKGQAEEVSTQLQKHYVEIEESLVSGNAQEQKWAKQAEVSTFARAQTELTQLLSDQNFMVAHTLATQMRAMTLAHRQVLFALASNSQPSLQEVDLEFIQDRVNISQAILDSVNHAFASKYAKVDFLKGIDSKLVELSNRILVINLELGDLANNLSNQERWSYNSTLAQAKMLEDMAKNYLGQDRYVESYKSANQALGLVLEMHILLQASQKFHVELLLGHQNN